METLERVQKTLHVVQIIVLVALIAALVMAAIDLTLGGCLLAGNETVLSWISQPGEQTGGMFLVSGLGTLLSGLALAFGWYILRREQQDGTPFTQGSAVRLRSLGLLCIVVQLINAAVSSGLAERFRLTDVEGLSFPGLLLGILLVIFAGILQYGSELEE